MTSLSADGSIDADAETVSLSFASMAGATIQVADSFTGTLSFQVTGDGQNYQAIAGDPVGGAASASSTTAGGVWRFSVGGCQGLQVVGSGWSAGRARITIRATESGNGATGTTGLVTGPVSIADGADVAEGATTSPESSSGNGTVIGILKRLRTIWNDVYSLALHSISVTIQNATLAVTQSGTWNVGPAPSTPPAATTLQSGATGNGDGSSLTITGYAGVFVAITGSMSGGTTVNLELSADSGGTWARDELWVSALTGSTGLLAAPQSLGYYIVDLPVGMTTFRARISDYSAGTVTVTAIPLAESPGAGVLNYLDYSTSLTSSINGKTPALGQALAAASVPVVLTAAQLTTLTTTATPAGAAIIGKVGIDQATPGNTNLVRLLPPAASDWAVTHAPAANTKATITKAAGTGTQRHFCTDLTVTIAAGASAPTAVQVSAALIDGTTGGSTYLWGPHVFSVPATAGVSTGHTLALAHPKIGSQATAMTLEFSAAGGANTIEAVSFGGYTASE